MKIAVSSMGTDLDAQVDPRFGRCQYFVIVNSDTLEFEAMENPNISAMGGAGIQSGQLMADKGVQVVLTGNVGPNAFQTMSAAGVQIITGVTGTVKEAIQRFNSGQLQHTIEATVPTHFGIGSGGSLGAGMGPGMGRGMGGGRGRGMGMGRGMGGGMGRGGGGWGAMRPGMQPMPPSQPGFPPQQPMSNEQELQMLKEQAEAMKQQLDQIANRIKDLEKK
jgi:predicted Fe-Mo cluster-binding NifX family protein